MKYPKEVMNTNEFITKRGELNGRLDILDRLLEYSKTDNSIFQRKKAFIKVFFEDEIKNIDIDRKKLVNEIVESCFNE